MSELTTVVLIAVASGLFLCVFCAGVSQIIKLLDVCVPVKPPYDAERTQEVFERAMEQVDFLQWEAELRDNTAESYNEHD